MAPPEGDTTTRRVLRSDDDAERGIPSPDGAHVSPSIYRIQRPDGIVLGPMSFPMLIELFATGEVGSTCVIALENGRFKPAAEYPELSRFLISPALAWDAELPTDAADAGDIDPSRLPTRFFHLAVRRETGVLVLRDGQRKRRIFFVEGSPECVTSTDKKELLGEFLIQRGQVLRMEVDMALAMAPRFGGRLGDALVGIGVLRPIELFRAIHDQTQERLIETFRWKSGEIAFARGVRSQEETFPLGVDTYELIGRGIRHGYKCDELEAILAPMRDEPLEPIASPPVRREMFRLSERETTALEALRQGSTLRSLLAEASASGTAAAEEVLRAVFLGLTCEASAAAQWLVPPTFAPAATAR